MTPRRRRLSATALLALTLAAYGSSNAGSAPSTTEATAATATTQVPAAAEPSFESSPIPDNPIGRQLGWFLDAMRDLPIPVSAIEEHFAASFLAVAPPDQLNALLAQAGDATAVRFLGVVTITSTSIDAAIDPGPEEPNVVISITVDSDGRIANLQFKPIPLGSRAEAGLAPISLPEPTGPMLVGTDAVVASDAARADRRIPVQLWYPADTDSEADAAPAPYASPATAAFLAEHLAIPVEDVAAVVTNATMAPDVAIGDGPLPIVLFSPGYGVTRPFYSGLAAELASHGYLVAVLDHTGEGNLVEFPDGTTVTAPPPSVGGEFDPEAAVATRLADARAVLDLLERLDAEPGGPFSDALDLSRVAFAGHSLGGATAAEAMRLDDRFHAGVNLDGTVIGDVVETGLDRPFLLMGTNDIEHDETWTTFLANSPSALMLAIDGTAHMNYSDLPTLATFRPADEPREGFGIGTMDPERSSAVQSAYLLAFLDHHLRGEHEPLLDAPSPEYPEVRFG